MRILIISYMVSSKKGSEYNVAWNHLRHLQHHHDITVIYGTNGDRLGQLVDDKDFLINLKAEKIFIPSDILIDALNLPNNLGIFKYSFYFAYKFWQKKAYYFCRDNKIFDRVELVHFLNPIGFREPGIWYRTSKPIIWGPIGGFPDLPNSNKLLSRNSIFNLINKFQRRKYRVKKTIKTSVKVFAATTENKKIIDTTYNISSIYLPENGIEKELIKLNTARFENYDKIQIVWIGSLEERKQFTLFFNAIAKLRSTNLIINIVGVPEIEFYNLKNEINFYPKINREKIFDILDKSHLHIITSIREGNPTVIWEATARGVPTLAFDNSGMRDTVSKGLGLLLKNGTTSDELAKKIDQIIETKCLLDLHLRLLNVLQEFSWENRIKFWNEHYQESIILKNK